MRPDQTTIFTIKDSFLSLGVTNESLVMTHFRYMTHRRKTGCRMQERRAKDYIKKGRSEKELQECGACLKGDFKTVRLTEKFHSNAQLLN